MGRLGEGGLSSAFRALAALAAAGDCDAAGDAAAAPSPPAAAASLRAAVYLPQPLSNQTEQGRSRDADDASGDAQRWATKSSGVSCEPGAL